MATVINNPPPAPSNNEGSSVGLIVGLIVVVAIVVLFLIFGLPQLRGTGSGEEAVTDNIPSEVNINLPDEINVDTDAVPGQPNP